MKFVKIVIAVFISIVGLIFASAEAMPLPPGSYIRTCNSCFYNNGYLHCTCLNRNQVPVRSRLWKAQFCAGVKNVDGNLVCHGGYLPNVPGYPRPYHMKQTFSAGPIYNQGQANHRCPNVCARTSFPYWTGVWRTVAYGSNSVCECRR
jgi:hypothetical protein